MYLILFALIAFLTIPSVSLSQTATCSQRECTGKAPTDHNHGAYHFLTKSRVYQVGNDHFYETCIENLGSNDLEVNWAIPGPESVVPVGCALRAPRPFARRATIDTYSSCLRFGASWDWDRSPFFPHESDQERNSNEAGKDCRTYYMAKAATVGESPVRDLAFQVERFGPSQYDNFKRTLSKIDFDIAINVHPEDGVFVTSISAKFSPAYLYQPEYYSKGFVIRPTEQFIKQDIFSGATGNPLGGYFGNAALIEYTLPIPAKPVQQFVRYAIFSGDEKSVASVDVPIWVNAE